MPTFREQMKGFPTWQIIVISIMRFLEPLAFTSLFPYIYYMIRDFEIAEDEASISTYAGYLSASFSFTQFLCSIYWGKLSDRIGRKSVLITGLFGTSFCMLTFGFAPNFYIALLARSVMGAVNGNVAVLRTMIGEMVTERGHQAIAFSTLPLLWNLGSVVGPLIGGSKYFTRPKAKSPYDTKDFAGSYDNFLDKYPYALSNVAVCVFLWVGILVGFLFLQETHIKAKYKRDVGVEIGDWILNKFGVDTPTRLWQKTRSKNNSKGAPADQDNSENSPLLEDDSSFDADTSVPPQQLYSAVDDDSDDVSIQSTGPLSRRLSSALIRRYSSKSTIAPQLSRTISRMSGISLGPEETLEDETLKEVFTTPVIQTITANFLMAFHSIVYGEFLPVFLAGKLSTSELQFPLTITGGFGLDSDTIGTMISTTGMCGVLVVTLVFPWLDRNYKAINNFRVAQFVFPLVYFFLPLIIFTLPDYNPSYPPGRTKVFLYVTSITYQVANAVAFPEIMLLIHRASNPKHRAFINGSALSLNALARFIGPFAWGGLMSYFDKIHRGGYSWWTLAIVSFGSLFQSFTMREYDEDEHPQTLA